MSEDESSNFCTNCGAPLHDSDTFCQTCGSVKGSQNESRGSYNRSYNNNNQPKTNRLMTVTILSLIWALIALALGLYLALGVDSIINNFMSIPEIWDLMLETYTEESLRSALIIEGSVLAVSGGLALVTAILSLKKRLYIIALITCILSSIFGLVMLVGFIGFIVAYLIYKAKDEFVDNKPTL